ncbi:MAG: hypothetical protein PHS84_01550 [Paludibacter sp.]|nr:hypothetical protein [Paludibacter sp.]
MKRICTVLFMFISIGFLFAQSQAKGDSHPAYPNIIVKIDGTEPSWIKNDNDQSVNTNSTTSGTENVSFTATSNGIYVTILKGTNKIRLLALTGQLLLAGDLTQGRFFIPTRQGMYFLKVNNKAFKVICK